MNKEYIKLMDQIKASDNFIEDTLKTLSQRENERRYKMKHTKKFILGIAAATIISFGAFSNQKPITNVQVDFDLTERIVVDVNAPSACGAVNIEGVITLVSDNGLSFKLDNGKWIHVSDETEIGITGPTAAKEQFFEPSFRLGNRIAGWSQDIDGDSIDAAVIYTNWNWDDPIR